VYLLSADKEELNASLSWDRKKWFSFFVGSAGSSKTEIEVLAHVSSSSTSVGMKGKESSTLPGRPISLLVGTGGGGGDVVMMKLLSDLGDM
jgi:hypothetical protein